MKKLLSVAVAAACCAAAFSASAADVTVYGRADLGLSYHQNSMKFNGYEVFKNKDWSMDSGNWTGSRFGLKGSEALGNGLSVGFILENGFNADTGALGNGSKLFDRQATLSVSGDFGTIYAGRMGALISDAGSVGFYAGAVSPFGSGMGDIAGHYAVTAHAKTRRDNAVAYVTPTVGGFTGYAQYAMGDTSENTSADDRYAAVGGTYENGPLVVAGVVDYLNRNTSGLLANGRTVGDAVRTAFDKGINDTFTFNLGGSYDFGAAKVFAAAQYFIDAGTPGSAMTGASGTVGGFDVGVFGPLSDSGLDFDGYGLNLGVTAPLAGGTAMLSAGYMDADTTVITSKLDLNAYTVLAGYSYDLSKRTSLYAAAGMTKKTYKITTPMTGDKVKHSEAQAALGLVHKF